MTVRVTGPDGDGLLWIRADAGGLHGAVSVRADSIAGRAFAADAAAPPPAAPGPATGEAAESQCVSCGSGMGTLTRGRADPRFCRRCDDALMLDELGERRSDRAALFARVEKAEAERDGFKEQRDSAWKDLEHVGSVLGKQIEAERARASAAEASLLALRAADEEMARLINGLIEAGDLLMRHVQRIEWDPACANMARECWLESRAAVSGDHGQKRWPEDARAALDDGTGTGGTT